MAEMRLVQLEHLAMATQFEIALYGENETYLLAVAEDVMREIDRLEAQLSFYREGSEVRRINALAAYEPVTVTPGVFELLERARALSLLTEGTFDVTVAPLMRCWGFVGASGGMPEASAIESARSLVGMTHITLDADNYTVAFDRPGVEIDLGAIGKGYAVERAVEMMREYEIESAILHGGTSAIYALGAPPDADAWQIAIRKPRTSQDVQNEIDDLSSREQKRNHEIQSSQAGNHLAVVELRDESLSVSAPHGKWFTSEGRRYGHVIDSRTGYPASRSLLAAIAMPSATDGDALSTGLLTLGAAFLPALKAYCPTARSLVAEETHNGAIHATACDIMTAANVS